MTYEIRDRPDGHFELVQMVPTTLGILTSRWVAERFADFLDNLDDDELRHFELIGADEEQLAQDFSASGQVETGGEADQPDPIRQDCLPDSPAPAASSELDDLLNEAFERLEAGEPVGVVADDIGMTMPKLRSRWAARCKQKKNTAPPPIGDSHEYEDCRMCGRSFRPTMDSDGLCARCNREMGGQ